MEFSPNRPPEARPFWRRPRPQLAFAALAVYALVLSRFILVCAGGSDSSGYLNHAKLLGTGHVHLAERAIASLPASQTPSYLYTPLGFKPAPNGRGLVPTYASGFPLLVMAAAKVVGWGHAGDVVILLHALLGVILTYALGRTLRLPVSWAVLGAAMIGASPLYLEYSLQGMSDLPALVWVTAAMLFAFQRENRLWPVAAGASLAMAVLIRPNNILALAPVLIALGASPRRWAGLILGGLPGAVFFCVHAEKAYGKLLATGYGDTWSSFSAAVVPETLLHYLRWLPALFTPVVLLVLGLPWLFRTAPRAAAALGAWALAYLAFYCAYYNTHETWWYLRFLLPAAPALILGGLLVLRRLPARSRDPLLHALVLAGAFYTVYHFSQETARHLRFVLPLLLVVGLVIAHHLAVKIRGRSWAIFAAALALVFGNSLWWVRKFDIMNTGRMERTYPQTMTWLNRHLPDNAVLAVMQTSGAALYYTPFVLVRWDELDPKTFPRIAAAARADGRPIFAVLYSFESAEAFQQHIPGEWSRYGAVGDVTIWRLNGG